MEREAGQCYSSRENHQGDRAKPAQHDGPDMASAPSRYRLAGRTATLYDPACRRSVPFTPQLRRVAAATGQIGGRAADALPGGAREVGGHEFADLGGQLQRGDYAHTPGSLKMKELS
jgi:hypothetical protein